MPAHLAVAIVADDPRQALEQARSLPDAVTLVEYRLDLMDEVDVPFLAEQSPIPAIFTCRRRDQGGGCTGDESERLAILKQALATNHLVDIEMDTLPQLTPSHRTGRVIGSWHDFRGMLGDWGSLGMRIHEMGADIPKLVGMAADEDDVLPPCAWLSQTPFPAIGIAMGTAGVATRLLAPRFPNAFLTFASLAQTSAPGQIHVQELLTRYGFIHIAEAAPLLIMLTPHPTPWELVQRYRQAMQRAFSRGAPWLLPIPVQTIHPGLLLALKLARAAGIIRLPDVTVSPELAAYGIDTQAYAWDIATSRPRNFLQPPTPETTMTFFSQGY